VTVSRSLPAFGLVLAAASSLAFFPSAAEAQKGLVYCPVSIDATGCGPIVTALTSSFPDGVETAYDGSSSTVDLATADLSAYAVLVVPSLADGAGVEPYGLLRDPAIAARLSAAFTGRSAVWSGTPDHGSTNRAAKDALLRNLAGWAKADAAAGRGAGIVVLQDNSDDAASRYGWLSGISGLSVAADTTFDVYSNVQAVTSTGQTLLANSSGLQIAYSNMASFGLVVSGGSSSDATGGRSSRVVLVTRAGETSASSGGIATVATDQEDYSPGETVHVTGTGWEPGETVSLLFHEDVDPPIHPDRTLTAVADESGQISNQEYLIDEEDDGIQFILTATGLTSSRTAQTTFTDGNKLQFNTAPFSVAFNVCSPIITVQMLQGNSPDNGAPTPVALSSSSAGGTFYSNAACTAVITSATIPTSSSTTSFFYKDANTGSPVITAAAGVGCSGGNCTVTQTGTITGPDLTITKTHTGNFTEGTPGSYTITVTNSGTATTSGTVTVTDVQPAGLTFAGAAGTGWTCNGTTTITCTRSTTQAAGTSFPAITLNATPTAAGSVTNVATVSGGGEANAGNNSASDPTTVVAAIDLTINKTHTGNFTLGVNGTYTLMVSNTGGTATTGTITVTDVLPTGLGFVSGGNANGWSTCTAAAQTVTCTRTTAVAAGGVSPNLSLVVTVAEAAFPSVTNTASVSGGGEPAANNGNNSDSDLTTVLAPDLTVNKSHTGSFTQGVNGTYTLMVSNGGGAITTGTITVTDVLPTGLGFVSGTGTGWNACTVATQTVTCVRPAANTIAAGGAAPAITLTVSVAAAAVPSVTNTASVAGGGEPAASNGNNSDSDLTPVSAGVDLTIDKSHTGSFSNGVNGTYSLTVSNTGGTVTNANVTVTDVLPAGLGFVSGTGTGWNACTVAIQTVTCVRPSANTIVAGGTAPALTLTVSVTGPAVPSVTNTASVAGGGEPVGNNGNNSDSDPTTVGIGVDLTIDKSHTGNFTEGINGSYTLTVSNGGTAATNTANVSVTDVLPTGLGFVSGTGTGWNACTVATQTVTCIRPVANTIAAGGAAPAITLTVSVGAAAVPSKINTASVAGGGEPAANNGNNSDSDPTTVIAANSPPVVDAGGPYTGNEGSAIPLNTATATDPDVGDSPTYKWTYVAAGPVDLGTTCSFSNDAIVQPTFTCNDDGAFTLTLTVNDGHSHIVHDDAGVTVINVKPIATAGGPYSGDEGSAITLAGSGNDPGDNDDDPKLTYLWTVNTTGIDAGGACTFDDATKKNAKVTCTDNSNASPFTLTLVATDDDGASSTGATAALTVKNAEPVADAGGPYNGNEGSAISLNGTVTDAGSHDTHTWSWEYVAGPGVDAGATCSFSSASAEDPTITCTDDGTVELTFTATDDNGGTGSDQAALTVKNVAPVAHAGGPYTGKEGEAIELAGSATDAGTNDGFTYKWTVDVTGIDAGGACTFDDDTKATAKVTCTDNSNATPFTLKLVATDDDGLASAVSQTNLTVDNADPVADAGGPYDGNEGSAISLNGTVTDAGSNDTHTWSWKYVAGVGVDAGATCSFSSATAEDPTITCTDDGTVELTFTTKDDNGGESSDNATLTLKNVKPVATAAGPYTGDEGSAIELNGSADDPGDNDDPYLTYLWTVNTTGIDAGGTCTFDDATKKNAKVTCTDDSKSGKFKLSLVASDDDGGTSTASYADLTVLNVAPVAEAGGPYDGDEGSPVSLHGSATDVGSNDTFTWKWVYETGINVDAGATCSFSDIHAPNPTITCTDDGTVKLTLTVKDDNGSESDDEAALTLANVKPVATAGAPSTGDEGSAFLLNGSATDAGTNDLITYKWTADVTGITNSGHCTFDDATKKDAKVTCDDNGTLKLTLTATDDDGGVGTDLAEIAIANVDPVANAGGGTTKTYSGNEGSAVQLYGSATDVGSNDTFTWAWEYTAGPGFINGATCQFDHADVKQPKITCNDNGTVKLTLTVSDDDGGQGLDYATLNVLNVDPVADAGGPYTGDEGAAISLSGSTTDAGSNDTHTWQWKYVAGAGLAEGATCSFIGATTETPTITCTDDGTVQLTFTATDDDGGKGSDGATLTLKNVAPVANAGGPYTGAEGTAISLNGSATDAGLNDVISYKWTVNTNSSIDAGGSCTFDNDTYKNAKVTCTDDSGTGHFTLSLVATDDDGGVSVASTADLAVTNATPVANAGGPYSGNEGAAISLTGSKTDPGSNDTHTYLWTYAVVSGVDAGATCSFSSATVLNPTITCTDDGSYKVALMVTDDDLGTNSNYATLTLQNVKPTIASLTKPDGTALPTTIIVAGTLPIKVSFSDPATNDTHTAQIDCGLGYVNISGNVTTGFQTSCTFATIGPKTIKVKVTDDDAGYDEKSHIMTVKYLFDGFYAPVDRPNTMNVSKAGQAIPLKWRLTNALGAPITDLTGVTVQAVSMSSCSAQTVDQIEEYAAGASGLQNQGNGNYQFNWKTPTSYANSCKSIALVFGAGGTSYTENPSAFFTFKP
jgi:uncharacterized repeat protein (TIGR01451 family)